jgi:catechol 2,3-dioxygenase-like lactoylglutathione lyase family enzyme
MIGAVIFLCACFAEAQFAEPNDRGVAFGHMHVVVEDLELHKRLWPHVFGAELVEKQGYTAVRLADALIFFRDAEPTAPSVETAIDNFGIKVRDLEGVLSKWRALGYEVDSERPGASGGSVAYITMPGGIRLALSEEPNQSASAAMGHVQLASPVGRELMAWYAERFGAIASTQDDGGYVASIPGSELRFEKTEKDRLPTDGTAIDHIGFEIQEWDAFIESLREAGIEFEFGPVHVESLDLWVAFFNDPGGILVEITHGLDQF